MISPRRRLRNRDINIDELYVDHFQEFTEVVALAANGRSEACGASRALNPDAPAMPPPPPRRSRRLKHPQLQRQRLPTERRYFWRRCSCCGSRRCLAGCWLATNTSEPHGECHIAGATPTTDPCAPQVHPTFGMRTRAELCVATSQLCVV